MTKFSLLQSLITFHLTECSLDPRECKDSIAQCIFSLFNALRNRELAEQEWLDYIIGMSNIPLYCWTKDPITKLQHINCTTPVFLCTSLSENAFNPASDLLSLPYKYFYKIYLKPNTFGILVNKISPIHLQEQECLIRLSDVDSYQRLKQ